MFDIWQTRLEAEKKWIPASLENQDTEKMIEVVHREYMVPQNYTGTINIARHAWPFRKHT